MVDDASEAEVAQIFEQAIPSLRARQLIFRQLLKSIAYCESIGCTAFAVTRFKERPGGFRLNVGQVEALACHVGANPLEVGAVVVALRLLVAGSDCVDKVVEEEEEDGVGTLTEASYASVRAPLWIYF